MGAFILICRRRKYSRPFFLIHSTNAFMHAVFVTLKILVPAVGIRIVGSGGR